jgi:hypothetical protein
MRVPFRLGCWTLFATALACGGERLPEAEGLADAMYDACQESAALQKLMIADFESMPVVSWFTGSDGTSTRVSPTPPGTSTTPLEARKCAGDPSPGSGFHILATGLTGYGYSFGFNGLNALPGAIGANYFDTSSWDGISMWVRKGSGPSASTMFAAVTERFTDPAGASLFTGAESSLLLPSGSYCEFNALDVTGDGVNDPTRTQCDRFGAGVGLGKEWRFYKLPFEKMRQRAYGRPSPNGVPDTRLLGLDFGLAGRDWDFWIDELAFYRDPR